MVELSQKRCFVMDTSLFISYVNGELWANHAAYQTNYPPCPILVPLDVKREFKKYAMSASNECQIPLADRDIEKLVIQGRLSVTDTRYSDEFSDGIDRLTKERVYLRTPKSLSVVDKKLVKIVEESLLDGKDVCVATADKDVEISSRMIADKMEKNITIYSPWNPIIQNDFYSSIETVISEHVYRQLYYADMESSHRMYLAVAKDVHIGGTAEALVCWDFAFGVYTRDNMAPLPKIDGVYFIPVTFARLIKDEERYNTVSISIASASIYAVHNRDYPTILKIFTNTNPMSNTEIIKMMRLNNKGRLPKNWLKNRLLPTTDGKTCRRIDDWHLAIHNKLSVGKLEKLRKDLAKSA